MTRLRDGRVCKKLSCPLLVPPSKKKCRPGKRFCDENVAPSPDIKTREHRKLTDREWATAACMAIRPLPSATVTIQCDDVIRNVGQIGPALVASVGLEVDKDRPTEIAGHNRYQSEASSQVIRRNGPLFSPSLLWPTRLSSPRPCA